MNDFIKDLAIEVQEPNKSVFVFLPYLHIETIDDINTIPGTRFNAMRATFSFENGTRIMMLSNRTDPDRLAGCNMHAVYIVGQGRTTCRFKTLLENRLSRHTHEGIKYYNESGERYES